LNQLPLFAEQHTVASPLCMYENCRRKGRAVLGEWESRGPDCRNRTVRCLKCACYGEQSENLATRKAKTQDVEEASA
jgi:hypothetical protein